MKRYFELALLALAPLPFFIFADVLHTPVALVALVTLLNWATALCYWLIPRYLQVDARNGSASIPAHLVPGFVQFIHWCGIHHRFHWPAMTAMAAGFGTHNHFVAWGGAAIVVGIDGYLLWHSATTAKQFRDHIKLIWGRGSAN